MTRVLVTGSAGYLGSVLCQEFLASGFEVLGVDNLMYNNGHALSHLLGVNGFTFRQCDVRQRDLMTELAALSDVIVPLAGIVGAPACQKNCRLARDVNHLAVADLVMKLSPRQRVLFPNTNSGYGHTDGTREVTEEDTFAPLTYYALSKTHAEKEVLQHPNALSFRLATLFGPSPRMRFDLMVNDFAARLIYTGSLTVFEPHFLRNFLHVRDAARAFVWMATRPELNGPFNLGLPKVNLTKLGLAYQVARRLGLSTDTVSIGQGSDPDCRNYMVSNTRMEQSGFLWHYTLDQGIDAVAQLAVFLGHDAVSRMRNA